MPDVGVPVWWGPPYTCFHPLPATAADPELGCCGAYYRVSTVMHPVFCVASHFTAGNTSGCKQQKTQYLKYQRKLPHNSCSEALLGVLVLPEPVSGSCELVSPMMDRRVD